MVANKPLGLAVGSVRPRPGLAVGPALVGLLGLALMGQYLGQGQGPIETTKRYKNNIITKIKIKITILYDKNTVTKKDTIKYKYDVIKNETTNKIQKPFKMEYNLIRDEIESTKHD